MSAGEDTMNSPKQGRLSSGSVTCRSAAGRQVVHVTLCVAFLAVVPYVAAAESSPQLTLVKSGRPASTIVIAENAPRWTRQAADWLQEYVDKTTGATLPIVMENQAPVGTLISIGETQMSKDAGIDDSGLKYDACKLVVKENVLYLLGRDNCGTQTHDYVGARGTCRAVITFLEDYCGVRWFLPSPQGEFTPQANDIAVPLDLDKVFQPAFAYTDGRSVYDINILAEGGKSLAALANNYRKGVKAAPGGHTYSHAVPESTYGDSHPEYFALIDGERKSHEWTPEYGCGHHLCSSNLSVKRKLVEYLQKRLDSGLDWQSLGQEDSYQRCQCDQCEKLDEYRGNPPGRWEVFQNTGGLRNNPPERLFLLHKAVIDELAKSHPDKKIMLMCYAPTAWPSRKIEYWGDNVIAELMNLNKRYIEAWKSKVSSFTGYTYWYNTVCPMGLSTHMTSEEVAKRIRYLYESGCVALSIGPEGTWGTEGPTYYMMGRLMGDPNQNYEAVIAEYCQGVYGIDAAAPMLDFFALLEERLAEVVPIGDEDISADARNVNLPQDWSTAEMYLSLYPTDVLAKLEGFIQDAERKAQTERNKGWVRLSRDQFDFLNLLTRMLASYRDWQADKTDEKWLDVKAHVEAFEAYRLKIVTYPKEYTDVWWPGHATFCKWLVGNLGGTEQGFYVSWEDRKAVVMKKGIKGMPMGYGTSYYYSRINEPLTLDFGKEP